MIRFLDAANAITLVGLASAVASAILAVRGRFTWAVCALIVSGLCDLFDGFVARKLKRDDERRKFGARLDSLVDACSFGFAPVFLLHAAGLRSIPELALLAFFAACAVWRLAYFDTVGLSEGHYVGLPVTYVALVLPLAFLAGFAGGEALHFAAGGAAAVLAPAMVSPFRVPKPGGAWYAVFALLAVAMIAVYFALGDRFGAATSA